MLEIRNAVTHPTSRTLALAWPSLLLEKHTGYGVKGLVCQSPLYKSLAVEGNKIRVRFDTGGSPLMTGKKSGLDPVQETPGVKPTWFEIAGADGKYVSADAVIDGDSVVVSAARVANPVAVRYAWANGPEGCNLYNKAGLPASPFRSEKK
jgi:sialate O-acetylesterase